MRRYALKLLLFTAIFIVFDKLFIVVANFSAEAEADKRLEYLLKGEMNKDLIIFGSSTGSRDIIASQLQEQTGLSTYNLCYPGSDVTFHDFVLQTLLKFNEKPEKVVLVVDDNAELLFDETIMFRKDRLYPLVKYSYIWKELARNEGRSLFLSRFLVLDRLNKYNFDLRQKRFTPQDTIFDCGSMPISWKPEGVFFPYEIREDVYPIDEELSSKLEAFSRIVKSCKANHIELIITFPPVYKLHSESFENRIRQLGGDSITYYVYKQENPVYTNADYYSDESHLLRKGAKIFTDELAAFLNEKFSQSTPATVYQ